MTSEKERPLAEVYGKIADELEADAESGETSDDPRWLKRNAGKFRVKARKREKGFEHKGAQKKRNHRRP